MDTKQELMTAVLAMLQAWDDPSVASVRRRGEAIQGLREALGHALDEEDGYADPPCALCQNKEHGADDCPWEDD